MGRRRIRVADVKEILVQWDAGASISGIAHSLGYSRPTVRKYVQAGERVGLVRGSRRIDEVGWERAARAAIAQVAAGPRVGDASQAIAVYQDHLAERVGSVRLSVLYQRLRDEQHLHVSWASFYRYARQHWPDRLRPSPRITVRLDDPPPGEEAQIDYFYVGHWVDPETEHRHRLSAFLMTLSHSRHQFLYPVLSEDATSWLEAHVAAFTFFRGAPRRLVPDNLGSAILKGDRYDPRVNRAYAELVRYYGCIVDPSRLATPTDKPRVERAGGYSRASFFAGRTFPSLAVMRREAVRWCLDVAGQRIHGTTGQKPLDVFFAHEQGALLALPPKPWEPVRWTTAKVHADCHLQVEHARYSVPYRYVSHRLDVRLSRSTVEIYAAADLVATYLRRYQGRSTRMEHYPEPAQAFLRASPQACLRKAESIGPATHQLVRELLVDHALHHLRQAQGVLRLVDRFGAERLECACKRALDAGDGRYRTVRGILERGADQVQPDDELRTVLRPIGAFLRGPAAFARSLLEAH